MGNVVGLITSQRKIPAPAPGPPFVLTSAANGLSVDPVTGKIVLGNDAGLLTAALLSNRDLPMGAFRFDWLNGTNRQFSVNPLTGTYQLGDIDGAADGGMLFINTAPGGGASLGDLNVISQGALVTVSNGLTNGGVVDITTGANLARGYRLRQQNDIGVNEGWIFEDIISGKRFFQIDPLTAFYALGDINGLLNSTRLEVDDGGRTIIARAVNGFFVVGDTTLIHTGTTLSNSAGVAAATMLNAPVAGDPTKWISINDNGTVRRIPAW